MQRPLAKQRYCILIVALQLCLYKKPEKEDFEGFCKNFTLIWDTKHQRLLL